ncbi:MAG: hypothetical protein AMK73_09715 [Planctomycetes bacterium SM23_32]|nr:MAG: hypothetical protein AMK73_09715 [Planctomycetes bacterium SM23_32]
MGRSLKLLGAAVCVVMVGCASPTPRQQEVADAGREQVAALLDSFVVAMREQSADLLPPLLSPVLKRHEVRRLCRELTLGSMLARYSGYTLEVQEAVDDVRWKRWQGDRLELEVDGSATVGKPFTEEFVFVKADDEWRILDFEIGQPVRGDPIEVPAELEMVLLPTVRRIIEKLEAGEAASLHYEVLPEHSRYRRPIQTWWERLTQEAPPPVIMLMQDMKLVKVLQIEDWPEPEDVLHYEFAPPNGVTAVYEVFYVWPAAGIDEADTLRIEMTFMPSDEGWVFYLLRLRGEAIPYS